MDGHLDMEYQYMVHVGGEHQVLDTDMELSIRSPEAGHGRKQRLLGTWRDLNLIGEGVSSVLREDQKLRISRDD